MERKRVYNIIDSELKYQEHRWDEGNKMSRIPDEEKSVSEWILYMEHHLALAKEAIYFLKPESALSEIRKVTALGVRSMEIHGCPERDWSFLLPSPNENQLSLDIESGC